MAICCMSPLRRGSPAGDTGGKGGRRRKAQVPLVLLLPRALEDPTRPPCCRCAPAPESPRLLCRDPGPTVPLAVARTALPPAAAVHRRSRLGRPLAFRDSESSPRSPTSLPRSPGAADLAR
ncbi:unnamed protein product [Prorocentrum cordatum]|uniref:Uncharacterized protein n=1 Tax=Prorocentrum cordatum TaxID=2364126 RepID=A0ABN9SLF0_9DINO|nr:unnamed protein product [Polarella glacialis]